MRTRKKAVVAISIAEIFAAAAVILVPRTVFPACEPPMHCHFSMLADTALAVIVVVAAASSILSKGMEAPRLISALTAVCGAFVIMFPSALMGVCASPMMACHYGALPVWNLMGGLIILLSAAMWFAAKEEEES